MGMSANLIFEHPRLAAVYDVFDDDRSDLSAYLGIAQELGAREVLDLGCGTGTFAVLAAARGCRVTGVEPAAASLAVARAKQGADRVAWILGDARVLPEIYVDLVTMTGNVAQAIADPADWRVTLAAAHAVLRPGGHLVFETRDPAFRAWLTWTRESTYRRVEVPGDGLVENWVDVTEVAWPLVTFRTTWVFAADGATLTSDSTLRFRERAEVEADLRVHGFEGVAVREAPDRPGREFVFVARVVG
jgi:SAM-dependent methyltransferase